MYHAFQEFGSRIYPSHRYCIQQLILSKDIAGDVVECGVGSCKNVLNMADVIRDLKLGKKLYAVDSYGGIPYNEEETPRFKKGDYFYMVPEQLKLEARLRQTDNIVIPVIGLVEEILPKELSDKKFSFVWLDLDLYAPTHFCIKFFENKISIGGILGSHDAFNKNTPGVIRALEEDIDKEKYIEIYRGSLSIFYKRIK